MLSGGPAIILAHPPRFRLDADASAAPACPFPVGSPAQKLWEQETKAGTVLAPMHFSDEHQGKGGFGGSTAEFALLALTLDANKKRTSHLWSWRERYRDLLQDAKVKPSGADLLAQLKTAGANEAQIVWVDITRQYLRAQAFKAPILIVRTGQKLKTHEHLETLENMPPQPELADLTELGWNALIRHDWKASGSIFNDYQAILAKRNWLAPISADLLEKIRAWPGFLGAKACGAMGADALALIFSPESLEAAKDACREQDLAIVWAGL